MRLWGHCTFTNSSTIRALFHNIARLCHCIQAELVLYWPWSCNNFDMIDLFGGLHLNVIVSLRAATHSRHVHDTLANGMRFIKVMLIRHQTEENRLHDVLKCFLLRALMNTTQVVSALWESMTMVGAAKCNHGLSLSQTAYGTQLCSGWERPVDTSCSRMNTEVDTALYSNKDS